MTNFPSNNASSNIPVNSASGIGTPSSSPAATSSTRSTYSASETQQSVKQNVELNKLSVNTENNCHAYAQLRPPHQSLLLPFDPSVNRLENSVEQSREGNKSVMQIIESEPLLRHYYCQLGASARYLFQGQWLWSPEFGQINQFGSVDRYYEAQIRYLLGALLSLSTNIDASVLPLHPYHPYPASDPEYRAAMNGVIRVEQHQWGLRTGAPKSIRLIGLELMHPNPDLRPSVGQAMKAVREWIDYALQYSLPLGYPIYFGHINAFTDSAVEKLSLAHAAVKYNRLDLATALRMSGVAIDAYDSEGLTPLQRAVESKRQYFVPLLVNAGADINVRSEKGDTALQLLMKTYQSGGDDPFQDATNAKVAFRHLVRMGADLSLPFADGTEPMIYATEMGSVELLQLLVKCDERGMRDEGNIYAEKAGKTALHYAILQLRENPAKIDLVKWVVKRLIHEYSSQREFDLYYFSGSREAYECNAECASILLALLKSNIVKAGALIKRTDLKYVRHALIALMYKNKHQLTKVKTLPARAIEAYQQVTECCLGHRDNVGEDHDEAAKRLGKALTKEFIKSVSSLWKPDQGLSMSPHPLRVSMGNELNLFSSTADALLRSSKIKFIYLDRNGQDQEGADVGGLTRQFFGNVWHQLFHPPEHWVDIQKDTWSLFLPTKTGEVYPELGKKIPSTSEGKYLSYQYLGKLIALSARLDTPSPVQLSPQLFECLDILVNTIQYYQINNVGAVRMDGAILPSYARDWSGFTVEALIENTCEESPKMIRHLIELTNQPVTGSREEQLNQLKNAVYDLFLEGVEEKRVEVIELLQTMGADLSLDASNEALSQLLESWGLPSNRAVAEQDFKQEARATLGVPALIALGIAKLPYAMDSLQLLGPVAAGIAVCGDADLRQNIINSIVDPNTLGSVASERDWLRYRTRCDLKDALKSFVESASDEEVEKLVLFWSGSRQLGNSARLIITVNPIPDTMAENIRSRTCLHELVLPMKLVYGDSAEGIDPIVNQQMFSDTFERFLSQPEKALMQFDFEPE